mgnify:CR=1 FL=1
MVGESDRELHRSRHSPSLTGPSCTACTYHLFSPSDTMAPPNMDPFGRATDVACVPFLYATGCIHSHLARMQDAGRCHRMDGRRSYTHRNPHSVRLKSLPLPTQHPKNVICTSQPIASYM